MKDLTRHLNHYLPLIGILAAGTFGLVTFSFDKAFQIALAVASASGYVIWGIVHHHIHKDLHASVIIEYLAIAIFGAVMIITVIFRA